MTRGEAAIKVQEARDRYMVAAKEYSNARVEEHEIWAKEAIEKLKKETVE
jgi:hypothetical protein